MILCDQPLMFPTGRTSLRFGVVDIVRFSLMVPYMPVRSGRVRSTLPIPPSFLVQRIIRAITTPVHPTLEITPVSGWMMFVSTMHILPIPKSSKSMEAVWEMLDSHGLW